MKEYVNKLKLFFYASLSLTLICAILRTLSIFTAFDTKVDYFFADALLPKIHLALIVVSLLFFSFLFVLIPRKSLPVFCPFGSSMDSFASASCGFVYMISMVMLYLTMKQNMNLISYAIIISGIVAAIFFIIDAFTASSSLITTKILLSMCVAANILLLIVREYMNYYLTINAPNKLLFFLSFASFAVFIIQSIKFKVDAASPRLFVCSALFSGLLCSASAIPGMICHYGKVLSDSTFLIYYFINLVFALYSFTKLNSYVKFVAIIPKISLELENTESSEELAEVKAEEREEEASSETES